MKMSAWVLLALAVLLVGPTKTFARTCEVALRLDDSVTLGALQLTIDYAAAPGNWVPTLKGIDCRTDVPNTLGPVVDDPASRIVTASYISLAGIVGPRKLAHCWFDDPTSSAVPGDFLVTVQEASNLAGMILGPPKISVLMPDCGPVLPTTTTTTTSTTTTSTTSTTLATTTTTLATTTTSTTTTSTTTTSTTEVTSTTLAPCGNGTVDDGEQCDDGNTENGDGCDAACSSENMCGDANGNEEIQTSDALLVLRAAVGQLVACPMFLCDVDDDARILVSDSLRVLRRAVGQNVVLSCPIEQD